MGSRWPDSGPLCESFGHCQELPDSGILEVKELFEAFAQEFEGMIFKEESILLMILLESFTQDDWLSIAEESDAYGYAIILPSEKWMPKRVDFKEEASKESEGSTEPLPSSKGDEHRQVIETPEGSWRLPSRLRKKKRASIASSHRLLAMAFIGGASEFNLEPVTNGDHLCQ